MSELADSLQVRGWAPVSFDMSQAERDEFMHISRDVILLASEDKKVTKALAFELDSSLSTGTNNPTFYGISKARNSDDKKLWLHGGYRTSHMLQRDRAVSEIPLMQDYCDALHDVLLCARDSLLSSLGSLAVDTTDARQDEQPLEAVFSPAGHDGFLDSVLHLRTVRYLDLDKRSPGDEVIEGHGDMGFATVQFNQSHDGYLYCAPTEPSMVSWDITPERIEYYQRLYGQMNEVAFDGDTEAAFMLGCAVRGLDAQKYPTRLGTNLPVGYHAGFLPEQDTRRDGLDWLLPNERVACIAFLHPRLQVLQDQIGYRLPSVETCRPLKFA